MTFAAVMGVIIVTCVFYVNEKLTHSRVVVAIYVTALVLETALLVAARWLELYYGVGQ